MFKQATPTKPQAYKALQMDRVPEYTCEYCGNIHKTRCDACGMPPCRCLC